MLPPFAKLPKLVSEPAPNRLAAVPAIALVAIAIWEIVASVRAARAVPHDDEWARAAAVVRRDYRPGDLIVTAPGWTDPIGRLHLGDLIPIETAARMDAARYGRIWELSIDGAHAPEVSGLEPVQTVDDDVTVRRYERGPAIVLADIVDRVASAKSVAAAPHVELAEVGFAPHRCIQVTPSPGTPARITFPELPLGSELVGYVGIADVFTRRDERSAIRIDVEIGGNIVAGAGAGVEDGWVRFAAPTTPGVADVTFVVTAIAGGKLACFAAETRK